MRGRRMCKIMVLVIFLDRLKTVVKKGQSTAFKKGNLNEANVSPEKQSHTKEE